MENNFGGIFENQKEVAENIKKSAESEGTAVNQNIIDNLANEKPVKTYVAKNNCNWCHGKGLVTFFPNKPKHELNTRKSQDFLQTVTNATKALCKCVKFKME